jgi:hypothetical protein
MAIIFHVELPAIETAFIQKNRVENTILAKLLQNTELALWLNVIKQYLLMH